MSVIRQKPFIEELISSLSIENIKEFRNLLNEGGDNVKLSFATLTNAYKNKVTPVYFELDNLNIKTALLVWSNTLCALVCYHRFQDILLIELDTTKHTYKKVNEYCDINELRRIVDDVLETKGAEILVVSGTSGELTDAEIEQAKMPDTVLRAGDDGAFYYKESQSEDYIVFKAFPRIEDGTTYLENITIDLSDNTYSYNAEVISAGEGFSPEYDTELNNSSTNAPQTKVVNAALEDKANVDGNYPTMTAGLADNLTPYSEDSGAEQDDPFISEGTGTGNGSEIVTTGDYALLKEKQGNSVVYNQLLKNPTFTSLSDWTAANATFTVSNNIGTLIATRSGGLVYQSLPRIASHRYLIMVDIKLTTATTQVGIYWIGSKIKDVPALTTKQHLVFTYSGGAGSTSIYIQDSRDSNWDAIEISNFYVIDLTQWFGSNDLIPSDLLTNPSHFINYYNGSLAYNTGELKNSDGVKLVSTGRNIYNPNETYNVVIPNKPFFSSKTTTITYYDKDKNSIGTESVSAGNTFTTPSNCVFINSSVSAITITPYYTDQEGGEGYKDNNNTPIEYAYEELKVYNTGTETLRSAGSVRDVKAPDGTITRKNGSYTFAGNESWTFDSDNNYFYATIEDSSFIQPKSAISLSSNGIFVNTYSTSKIIRVYLSSNPQLTSSSNLQNYFVDGTKMNYELLTPTTEQGTSFSKNLQINDYGMLYWLNSDDELVGIPQGNKIFYPVNYKGFIDDVYARTDGDASKLALESDITDSALNTRGYFKMQDLSSNVVLADGISATLKKAYKCGNVMTISLILQNTSGDEIVSYSTLFTLASGMFPTNQYIVEYVEANSLLKRFRINPNGEGGIEYALPNNAVVYINLSYAVA